MMGQTVNPQIKVASSPVRLVYRLWETRNIPTNVTQLASADGSLTAAGVRPSREMEYASK